MAYARTSAALRFLRRMSVDKKGCWIWSGYRMPNGYGQFAAAGGHQPGMKLVHRWAYEQIRGAIPPGLVIDHLCQTRNCANPWHMEVVTQTENVTRSNRLRKKVA